MFFLLSFASCVPTLRYNCILNVANHEHFDIEKNYYLAVMLVSQQLYDVEDVPLLAIVDLVAGSGFSGCVRCYGGGVMAGTGSGRRRRGCRLNGRRSGRQLAVSVKVIRRETRVSS